MQNSEHNKTCMLTLLYLILRLGLKGEDWPLCIPCQEPFSVKHFLLDCTDFRIIRSRFYRVNNLKELFDTVEPVRIFSFLREIGL